MRSIFNLGSTMGQKVNRIQNNKLICGCQIKMFPIKQDQNTKTMELHKGEKPLHKDIISQNKEGQG